MIAPLTASTIGRTAPVARVRRRRPSGRDGVGLEEAEPPRAAIAVPAVSIAPPGMAARRASPTRPTPAFLSALMALRRGGA